MSLKNFFRFLFGFLFILAGSMHFINPQIYLKIIPPYIPFPLFMVYLSGLFEILLGIGLCMSKLRKLSAWGLILLLLAVFPANIQMTLNHQEFPQIPLWVLILRLPLQFALIYWAYLYTRD
ncbi:MAG: DoxX family membrane protein [Candidatus Caenarcaniphilales bacterium]|nr:DoxX family membrane protein [Candidatus Caenarcaniphilales bacterium]